MREDGYSTDAEGFNLQSLTQGLGTALPGMVQGATQGAAVGTTVAPGWGTLIGALGGAALSLASQQGSTPSGSAPARPAPQPAPAPTAPPPAASSPAASFAPAPSPAAASPLAALAGGGAGNLGQVLSLLQNPQVQQLLGSFLAQRAGAASASGGKPGGSAEAEAESGGAIDWLMSQRVARLG